MNTVDVNTVANYVEVIESANTTIIRARARSAVEVVFVNMEE